MILNLRATCLPCYNRIGKTDDPRKAEANVPVPIRGCRRIVLGRLIILTQRRFHLFVSVSCARKQQFWPNDFIYCSQEWRGESCSILPVLSIQQSRSMFSKIIRIPIAIAKHQKSHCQSSTGLLDKLKRYESNLLKQHRGLAFRFEFLPPFHQLNHRITLKFQLEIWKRFHVFYVQLYL